MDRREMVEISKDIVEKFSDSYGKVDLTMFLRDKDVSIDDDKYILLFSSSYLDSLSPLKSTYKVVEHFAAINKEILKKISSIIVVHSEDNDINKIKELMSSKDSEFFLNNISLEFFGMTIDDAIILKTSESFATA